MKKRASGEVGEEIRENSVPEIKWSVTEKRKSPFVSNAANSLDHLRWRLILYGFNKNDKVILQTEKYT